VGVVHDQTSREVSLKLKHLFVFHFISTYSLIFPNQNDYSRSKVYLAPPSKIPIMFSVSNE
jgi:hypothetical protein